MLCNALTSIGVASAEQDILFRLVSAVLSLWNIDFQGEETVSEGEVAVIDESYTVDLAAQLLGVKRDALDYILLNRSLSVVSEKDINAANSSITEDRIQSGRAQYVIKRDVVQASYARDSMAKSLYEVSYSCYTRLFKWLFC